MWSYILLLYRFFKCHIAPTLKIQSGVKLRLRKIEKQIESMSCSEPTVINIQIGRFKQRECMIENTKLVRATGGGRSSGSTVYGITFKFIPESQPAGRTAVKDIERLLRRRYPKYRDALKLLFKQNNLKGSPEDIGTWSYPYKGAVLSHSEDVPSDIRTFASQVLVVPTADRKINEFSKRKSLMELQLSQRHRGYDCFKQEIFERRKIQGDFRDMMSWSGLDPEDHLDRSEAQTEIRGFVKALGRQGCFFLSDGGIVLRIREDPISSKQMITIARKMWAIRALISPGRNGLLIYDDCRLLIYVYFAFVFVVVILFTIKTSWLTKPNEIVDFFLAFAASIPALWCWFSKEQDPVWAALRGQRYLCDDDDVIKTFDISEEEVAVYGLIDGGCPFLSSERMCHNPDKVPSLIKPGSRALTTSKELRKVGIFVGRQMARRAWEEENLIVVPNENGDIHITNLPSKAPWSTGLVREVRVG